MEIHTQNLLSVTIDANMLTSNFIAIEKTLKQMQNQIDDLLKTQGTFQLSIEYQNNEIRDISKMVRVHDQTIKAQNKLLEQLGFQQDKEEQSQCQSKPDLSAEQLIQISNNSSAKHQQNNNSRVSTGKKERQHSYKDPIQHKKKQHISTNKLKPTKSGADKFMSSFKDRLFFLEKENDQKQIAIAELQQVIEKIKGKSGTMKKTTQSLLKRGSMKKPIFEQKHRPSLIVPDFQVKLQSGKSFSKSITEGQQSSETINFDGNLKNEELGLEMEQFKLVLVQKLKVIEAQYKQSQHRAQNIEKTMDLLERNYEMLKYDFDRTSTSWSKNRPIFTNEKFRSEEGLFDPRLNDKQLDEEKLMELFQDMDKIKKQYIEIQAKLSKDTDDPNKAIQGCSDAKDKSSKIVHTLKSQGGQSKKQIALLKRQLIKLKSQFQDFAFGVNTNVGEVKTVVIKPNQNKEDWKILSTKIYKLKMELQSGLREMESKIATNNDMVVVLNSLQTGIQECRLLIKRKVDHTDYEKGLKRIQTRLNNFITQVYQKQNRQLQADVSMAKQPWFCLSCDSELKNYTYKVSKSPSKQKLAGRKVNPESHMVRRNQNGRFPSVLK